jgi:succinate dehydrogenase / fumarate reductase flavoprotein subunit
MTHLGAETIMKRLPSVFEIGKKFANVDITKEPIPVVPTIHYQMGGIPTNIHGQVVVPESRETSPLEANYNKETDVYSTNAGERNFTKPVKGFYAIGECSCVSVHGANRLGTNSLLDLVVFGKAAGEHIIDYVTKHHGDEYQPLPTTVLEQTVARIRKLDESTTGENAQEVADAIRDIVQDHAGVFRTQALLDKGVKEILAIESRVRNIHLKDKSKVFNTARIEALEVENLYEVAKATLISAAARKECRGAHTVVDFEESPDHPEYPYGRRDDEWMKHTLWFSADNRLEYKPVRYKPLSVAAIPPKPRTF